MTSQRQRDYIKLRSTGVPQSQAAIEAGYSPASAAHTASKLEANATIRQAIQRAQAALNPDAVQQVARLAIDAPTPEQLADPLNFFSAMMQDAQHDPELRLKAAKALAQFTLSKPSTKPSATKEGLEQARHFAEHGFFSQHRA